MDLQILAAVLQQVGTGVPEVPNSFVGEPQVSCKFFSDESTIYQ